MDHVKFLIFFWENADISIEERNKIHAQYELMYKTQVPPCFCSTNYDTIPVLTSRNPTFPKDPKLPKIKKYDYDGYW